MRHLNMPQGLACGHSSEESAEITERLSDVTCSRCLLAMEAIILRAALQQQRGPAVALPEPKAVPVELDYTNWKGERRIRRVVLQDLWFGEAPYHEGPQWFLRAFDVDKQAQRTFALLGCHGFARAPEGRL